MEHHYKPPFYDPLEVFNPSKTFLREVIKQLKERIYATQENFREIEREFGYLPSWLEDQRKKTLGLIKRYEYWIASEGKVDPNKIGESEIRRAKEVPITSLYSGRLRRTGRTWVGRCTFHEERTGSFTIYIDKNIWNCFGCNRRGDAIDYVQLRDNLNFFQAVKFLI